MESTARTFVFVPFTEAWARKVKNLRWLKHRGMGLCKSARWSGLANGWSHCWSSWLDYFTWLFYEAWIPSQHGTLKMVFTSFPRAPKLSFTGNKPEIMLFFMTRSWESCCITSANFSCLQTNIKPAQVRREGNQGPYVDGRVVRFKEHKGWKPRLGNIKYSIYFYVPYVNWKVLKWGSYTSDSSNHNRRPAMLTPFYV